MFVFIVSGLIEIATLWQSCHEGARFGYYYVNLSSETIYFIRGKGESAKKKKIVLEKSSYDFALIK